MGNDVIYCVFLVLMASLARVIGLRPLYHWRRISLEAQFPDAPH